MFRFFLVEVIQAFRQGLGEFEKLQWVFLAADVGDGPTTLVDLRTPHVMLELNDASMKPSTSFCCYLAGTVWEDTFEETSGGSLGGDIWKDTSGNSYLGLLREDLESLRIICDTDLGSSGIVWNHLGLYGNI